MTHLTGIRLVNWTRFRGTHEVTLGPGTWAIQASRTDDPERSNYTGKTALTCAILWALYGRTELGDGRYMLGARTLDDLCSYGESDFQVDLEYSDGCFVSRQKRRGSSAALELQTSDGRKLVGDGAQDEIDRLLAGDRGDALSTWFALQRRSADLVTAKSTAAIEQLESWLGLERLQVASDSTSGRFAEKGREVARAREELARLEREGDEQGILTLERRETELAVEYETATKRREAYVARQESRQAGLRLATDEVELASLQERLRRVGRVGGTETVDPELEKRYSIAQDRVAAVSNRLVQLRRSASGSFDGACPASRGFACPVPDQINARRVENQKAVADEERSEREERGSLETARQAVERARDQVEETRRRSSERESLLEQLRKLERHVETARARGVEPERDLASGSEVVPVPDARELERVRLDLERAREARQSCEEARQRVERLSRELRVLRAAASVLGPEGARKRACLRAVQEIEGEANRVLVEAGVGLGVRAVWGRETDKPAEQCSECGAAFPASVRVKTCGCGAMRGVKVRHEFGWRVSEATDGAAIDLVGVVLRCAAYRRLRVDRPVESSLMILDEPAAHFDRANRRLFATSLRRILEGTFEQAFVTAHSDDVLAGCSRRIVVVGDEKWSRLETR